MGYNLLINGVYWGHNPFTNHLLTSWDILVHLKLGHVLDLPPPKTCDRHHQMKFVCNFWSFCFVRQSMQIEEIVYNYHTLLRLGMWKSPQIWKIPLAISFTFRPWKVIGTQKERIVRTNHPFSGAVLNFGGVNISKTLGWRFPCFLHVSCDHL